MIHDDIVIVNNIHVWSIWNNDSFEGLLFKLPIEWNNIWIDDYNITNNLKISKDINLIHYLFYFSVPLLLYYSISIF
jgi:hypothetical protein